MEAIKSKTQTVPWRGILALFGQLFVVTKNLSPLYSLLGGFLIQLTLGSFYSFGNMMTYLTSYMRYTVSLLSEPERICVISADSTAPLT